MTPRPTLSLRLQGVCVPCQPLPSPPRPPPPLRPARCDWLRLAASVPRPGCAGWRLLICHAEMYIFWTKGRSNYVQSELFSCRFSRTPARAEGEGAPCVLCGLTCHVPNECKVSSSHWRPAGHPSPQSPVGPEMHHL